MLKFWNEKETKNASVLGINIYEEKTGKMYLKFISFPHAIKDIVDAYEYVAYYVYWNPPLAVLILNSLS